MLMTMHGKICLITGGTNGIGKSAAQGLARLGATVVIGGRDAQKTSQVVADIRSATGNPNVDSLLADLSSQQAIRHLARNCMCCSTMRAEPLQPGSSAWMASR
jgi:retinol dehydrogenase-12